MNGSGCQKAEEVFPGDRGYGVQASENGSAQGVPSPEVLDQQFVDPVLGVVLAHPDFFQDDLALPLDLLGSEDGPEEDVRKDLHAPLHMLDKDLHVPIFKSSEPSSLSSVPIEGILDKALNC